MATRYPLTKEDWAIGTRFTEEDWAIGTRFTEEEWAIGTRFTCGDKNFIVLNIYTP